MFKFVINNTPIVDIPEGWQDMQSAIKRDDVTGTLLYDSSMKLTFYGGQDGYTILKNGWEANPIGESSVEIFQREPSGNYLKIHSGTIFHSSIEFMLINNSLSFKTEDNGFYAVINNNKKIETVINSGRTKNEVVIGACPSFTLSVHKISNGTVHFTCQAFKMIDVLKYMVQFMSDNRMTCEAPCFDTGGVYEGICLVVGNELINQDQKFAPKLSWETLSEDLVKRLNVQFSMAGSMDNPVMLVNDASNFFAENIAKEIATTPNEIMLSTDEGKLYSVVEVGSEKFETTSALQFPDIYPLTSFRTESLHFQGTNNIDKKLDLVGKLVVSHASIEVVSEQLSGYESYGEDVFMISYIPSTNHTKQGDWENTGKHLFNEIFINVNVLNRWAGYLPNEVANGYDNPGQYKFEAIAEGTALPYLTLYQTADLPTPNYYRDDSSSTGHLFEFLPFWNDYITTSYGDGNDASNSYGGATTQGLPVQFPNLYFTAAINAKYSFGAGMMFKFEGTSSIQNFYRDKKMRMVLRKRNAGGTVIESHNGPLVNVVPLQTFSSTNINAYYIVPGGIYTSCWWTTYMNAGEQMEAVLEHWVEDIVSNSVSHKYKITAIRGSFFCWGVTAGSLTVMPSDPKEYKSLKIEFDYPMTLAEYDQLRNSKEGFISVPCGANRTVKGWIQNVKFQHNSGESKFILLSNANSVYQ